MREPHDVTLVTPHRGDAALDGVDRWVSGLSHAQMAELLSERHVMLKLSRVEGMYGPPLEAFHMGATCVTTPVTGFDEYVDHGWNGVVVGWDDPHGTARALDLLARDRARLALMRDNALATARAWPSWEQSSRFMALALRAIHREPPPEPRAAGRQAHLGLRQRALREPARSSRDRDPARDRGGHQGAEDVAVGAGHPRAPTTAPAPRSGASATRCAGCAAAASRRGRAVRAARRDVAEEVAHERRPHARGAVLLGLLAPADAHALEGVGEGARRRGDVRELLGEAHLDVVQAALEAVGRAQRLADHEVPGREVQQHAVLEGRVGLVVDVEGDLVAVEQPLELLDLDPEGDVQAVEAVLDVEQPALAVHASSARRRASAATPTIGRTGR